MPSLLPLAGQTGGGCIHTTSDVVVTGSAEFAGCSATGDGGGMAAGSVISFDDAKLTFANCTADGEGRFSESFGVSRSP